MTITSTTNPTITYDITVHNGLAVDCTCKARQYRKGVQCKHMKEAQAQLQSPVETPTVLFSVVCGHRVKRNIYLSCGCEY